VEAATATSTTTATKMPNLKPLIVFCHGSGDTGSGVQAWVESLVPQAVMNQFDWSFPTAKPIPYALSGGAISSVWYDRIGGFDPSFPEHTASVEASCDKLLALLDDEVAKDGRDSRQIVVGGFSMGGAIAYQTAARWHATRGVHGKPLGAVFALSSYLCHDSKVWSLLQQDTMPNWPPTFVAHGADDDFILPTWGQETYDRFVGMGAPNSKYQLVPHTHHEMVGPEMAQLIEFLSNHVLEEDQDKSATTTKASPSEL